MRISRSTLARLRASHHLRSVGSTTIALVASQVLMAVAGVLAARSLGPSGRGVVAAVISWPILIGWLSLLGINTAASVRIAGGHRSDLGTTLGTAVAHSIVVGGVVTLGAMFVVPPALAHLGDNADVLAMFALATIPMVVLADILMWVNVALGRIALANWARLVGPTLLLVGTVLLVLREEVTPTTIVALNIIGSVVALALTAIGLPWRRIALSVSELRADLKFGFKAQIGGVLGLTNTRLDLLVMSAFVASSQVGYYAVANNMMVPVISLAAAAGTLLTPKIARMGSRNREGVVDASQLAAIRREQRLYLILASAGGIALAAITPVVIPLLYGPAFNPAVVLVLVLIPGYVARVYIGLASAGTLGLRRPWVGNVTEGAGLVVTATLLPILLPRYDALGAAITSTAAYTTSALVAMFAMRHLTRQARSGPKPGEAEHPDFGASRSAAAAATPGR